MQAGAIGAGHLIFGSVYAGLVVRLELLPPVIPDQSGIPGKLLPCQEQILTEQQSLMAVEAMPLQIVSKMYD